jgi:hypothetical protein
LFSMRCTKVARNPKMLQIETKMLFAAFNWH